MPDGMDDMTPEEIIGAALSAPSTWPVLTGSERVVKALTEADKVIVDREPSEAIWALLDRLFHQAPIKDGRVVLEGASLDTFKTLADLRYSRAMTKDTGS